MGGIEGLDDEIEVTPEMIEAGLDRLYDLPELLGPTEKELGRALAEAFRAMDRVRRR